MLLKTYNKLVLCGTDGLFATNVCAKFKVT